MQKKQGLQLAVFSHAGGGSSTGEHGIGLAKNRWCPQAVSENSRELHRAVKQTLDPHGILNPGNFVWQRRDRPPQ